MVRESSFHRGTSFVKLVQACLCNSKDLESSFDHDGSPVKLVQACLCTYRQIYKAIFSTVGALYSMYGLRSFDCGGSTVELV